MNANSKHSLINALRQDKKQAKDTKNKRCLTQMNDVFEAFTEHPKTMLEVARETGVMRANICRYVAKWRKVDRIGVCRYGICSVSTHKAGFYTTDPNKAPDKSNQLKMF